MNGFTAQPHFCQLKLIDESSAFAFQLRKAASFLNNG